MSLVENNKKMKQKCCFFIESHSICCSKITRERRPRTDGQADGNDLLQRCEVTSKNVKLIGKIRKKKKRERREKGEKNKAAKVTKESGKVVRERAPWLAG